MALPFAWMYRDPAEVLDRMRDLQRRDKEFQERERKRQQQRGHYHIMQARAKKGQR